MNAATIDNLLDDLLDSAVAELTSPPARQFVAHGGWAHDCECVAVSLRDWSLGPAGERADFPVVNEITLTVTVLRCYPSATGDEPVPDASDLTTSTNTLLVDLAELTEGLSSRWDAGTLFPNVPALEGTQVSWLGARPVGPEGGFAGWECSITIRS